jgi:hypothetical protein
MGRPAVTEPRTNNIYQSLKGIVPGEVTTMAAETVVNVAEQAAGQIAEVGWLPLLLIALLILFVLSTVLLDLLKAYGVQKQKLGLLKDLNLGDLPQAEKKELAGLICGQPGGLRGVYRAVMAITVLLVLGFALLILIGSPDLFKSAKQIVDNILSVLTGALSAIIGFYYGGRAAYQESESRQRTPAGSPEPVEPAEGRGGKPKRGDSSTLSESAAMGTDK